MKLITQTIETISPMPEIVRWTDTFRTSNDTDIDCIRNVEMPTCDSIGFVVDETDKLLCLAISIFPDDATFRHILYIQKPMIIKRTKLFSKSYLRKRKPITKKKMFKQTDKSS